MSDDTVEAARVAWNARETIKAQTRRLEQLQAEIVKLKVELDQAYRDKEYLIQLLSRKPLRDAA